MRLQKIDAGSAGGSPALCVNTVAGRRMSEVGRIPAGSAGGSPALCVNTVAERPAGGGLPPKHRVFTPSAASDLLQRTALLVGANSFAIKVAPADRINAVPSDNTGLSDGARFARLSDLRTAFHVGAGLPAIDAGQRPALPAQEAWV